MPHTPAFSHAHISFVRPLRKSWLVRRTAYVLLVVLLTCLGDQRHAPESPARLAAASTEAPLPAEASDVEKLNASESPDHCHGLPLRQGTFPQPSPRIPPPAVAVLSLTDATATYVRQHPGAARRLLPSGGRFALTAICLWRL